MISFWEGDGIRGSDVLEFRGFETENILEYGEPIIRIFDDVFVDLLDYRNIMEIIVRIN